MLTRKGAALAAVLVALATTAALLRSWVLALAVVPLFLALVVGLVRHERPLRVRVSHSVPRRRFIAGDVVEGTLTVTTEVTGTRLCEVLVDLHPSTAAVGGAASFVAHLTRSRPVSTRYDLSLPMRGRFRLGSVLVRERGVLGLFSTETRVDVPDEITVLPRGEPLDGVRPLARRHRPHAGAFSIGRIGAGQEFFGLRNYLPGDGMDVVNWKQTAKRGRPIVNEYEHEVPADMVIVLDAREYADVGAGELSTLEACVRAAASISERATRDRFKVGFVALTDRLDWIHPSAGRRQHEKIVDRLLDVRRGGRYELEAVVPHLPPNVLPKGSTAVLVTPAHVGTTLPRTVVALGARGVRVLVVAPSPELAELAGDKLGRNGEVAARLLSLGRSRFLDSVRRSGAVVVDWDAREPLAAALASLEARR